MFNFQNPDTVPVKNLFVRFYLRLADAEKFLADIAKILGEKRGSKWRSEDTLAARVMNCWVHFLLSHVADYWNW